MRGARTLPGEPVAGLDRIGSRVNDIMKMTNNTAALARRSLCICLLAMTSELPAATTPERSAIEDQFKWDLTKMYATQDDWEAHYKRVGGMVHEFAALK